MGAARIDAARMNPAALADGSSLVYPALDAPIEG
jgi:hypothetical protein